MATKIKSVLGKRMRPTAELQTNDSGLGIGGSSASESEQEARLSDESDTDSDDDDDDDSSNGSSATDAEEDLPDDLPTCEKALEEPMFEENEGQQACAICPAKQFKNGQSPKDHLQSNSHGRRMKRFRQAVEEAVKEDGPDSLPRDPRVFAAIIDAERAHQGQQQQQMQPSSSKSKKPQQQQQQNVKKAQKTAKWNIERKLQKIEKKIKQVKAEKGREAEGGKEAVQACIQQRDQLKAQLKEISASVKGSKASQNDQESDKAKVGQEESKKTKVPPSAAEPKKSSGPAKDDSKEDAQVASTEKKDKKPRRKSKKASEGKEGKVEASKTAPPKALADGEGSRKKQKKSKTSA